MNAVVGLLIKYLEAHPDQVEALVEKLVEAFISHTKAQAAQKSS